MYRIIFSMLTLVMLSLACSLSNSGEVVLAPTPLPNLLTLSPSSNLTPTPTLTPSPSPTRSNATTGGSTTGGSTTGSSQQPSCSPRTDWIIYTVKAGDTLGRLAERTGSTVQQLSAANCLSNANMLSVGQSLRVPRSPVDDGRVDGLWIVQLTGLPPSAWCAVRNQNSQQPVSIYSGPGTNTTIIGRLVTYAQRIGGSGDWYQIDIPNPGAGDGWVPKGNLELVGDCSPFGEPSFCRFTPNTATIQTYVGPSYNFPVSSVLSGSSPIPVQAQSADWIQIGAGDSSGWVERSQGIVEGACENLHTIPIEDYLSCKLTMSALVDAFAAPSFEAELRGQLQPNQQVTATQRTASGWFGFDMGIVPGDTWWIPVTVEAVPHISQTIGCTWLTVSQ